MHASTILSHVAFARRQLFRWLGWALLLACGSRLACGQIKFTQLYQLPTSTAILWSVTDGNFGIVAVGDNGTILHSVDGVTWVARQSNFTGWLVAVTYGNGRYVAVGEGGTILSSTNGVVWLPVAATGTTSRLNNIQYAQGKFVAVGEGGALVVSNDGTTWRATPSGVNGAWLHGLAYTNGVWITTGQGGAIATSLDGLAWTKQPNPSTKDLEAVTTYSQFIYSTLINYITFLAVGEAGTAEAIQLTGSIVPQTQDVRSIVSVSTFSPGAYDGLLYSAIGGTNTTARLRSLTNANHLLVATGEDGTVITSPGLSGPWTRLPVATTKNLVGAGALRSTLVLVGESETILQSDAIFISRMSNVSTRGATSPGANTMTAGIVIQGTLNKFLLVRGVGPTLATFGVPNVLADPVLTVFDRTGKVIGTNAGWSNNGSSFDVAQAAVGVGAFALGTNSKDAALVLNLKPGAYTMQLSSTSGASGNGLIEAYDLDALSAASSRAINLSTLGQVGAGGNLLVAGLVIQGQSSRTVLVRAVGPGLTSFGVSGAIADPLVKVVGQDGTVLATNDNWGDSSLGNGVVITADDILTASASAGAFGLPTNSKDAALIITLVPGAYTIQVSGANGTTGIGLVEAYDLPNN